MRLLKDVRTLAPAAVVLLLAAGATHAAWPAPYLNAYQAGFTDAEHTLGGGVQFSIYRGMNASNQVIGASQRTDGGQSAWSWTWDTGTTRTGLVDALHTGASNQQDSLPDAVNAAGQVVGHSAQYLGDSQNGRSAWVWSTGAGTTRLGFTDADHTNLDGNSFSSVRSLTDSGMVTGSSERYSELGLSAGLSAWVWTAGGGHVRLGFTDAEHTSAEGIQSAVVDSSAPGDTRLTGSSSRFDGLADIGISAWTWSDSTGHTRLGFTDADHTGPGGYQSSTVAAMNAAEQIAGYSTNYVGGEGSSAWVWNATSGHTRIGLIDSEHTSTTGLQTSSSSGIMQNNNVLGVATRYDASSNEIGNSTWVWSPGSGTVNVGLTNAEHTNPITGTRVSAFRSHTPDSDRTAGVAVRYSASGSELGTSAWTWSEAGGTVRIGLTDAGHTTTNGSQFNEVILADSDRVVGSATRYVSNNNRGTSIWTWSEDAPGASLRIGLFDTPHTATDSRQITSFIAMNDAGQIVGNQQRYSGNVVRGASGWFFDSTDNTVLPLVFSVGLQNRATTIPTILTDTGLVFGNYDKYASTSSSVVESTNAFVWSRADGMIDLGALVDGGLSAYGWNLLSSVLSANELEAIAGYGSLIGAADGSQAVYVLTVPTPGALGLLALGGVTALRRRRGERN